VTTPTAKSQAPALREDGGQAQSRRSDAELIDRVRGGETAAFRYLVERHEHRVATTVTAMLGATAEADDVGQETFIRFYRALDSFRGDSSVATYLNRIAINLSLNALKRRKRSLKRFLQTEDLAEMPAEPVSPLDSSEKRQLIQQALQALQPAFRAVVVLRLIEGYSTRETADLLNLPLGTVLSRLARAQRKMRDWLLPYIDDEYK
jgi:RNA polymerase sigma-70 factor (ECF subfamily)